MKKQDSVLITHSFIFIFVCVVAGYIDVNNYYPPIMIRLLSWCLVFSFIWIIYSWKILTNRIFDPYIIFIFAGFLFNAGFAFLEVFPFGFDVPYLDFFNLEGEFINQDIASTLMFILLGFLAFHLGAIINTKILKPNENHYFTNELRRIEQRKLRLSGWSLLLISVIPTLYSLTRAIQLVNLYGYKGGWIQLYNVSSTVRILGAFYIPGILFLLAGSKKNLLAITIAITGILIYSGAFFYIGARRFAIAAIVSAAWVWDRCIEKIPRKTLLIVSILMLFFIVPLISNTRKISGIDTLSLNFLTRQLLQIKNPIQEALLEFGRTLQIVAYTIKLVPDIRPFSFGQSYLNAIFSTVPNLFWDVHPTAVHNLAQWLTWTLFPTFAQSGGGFGFSFIAEAYLNFGWLGSLIFIGLLGFLYSRFVLWAANSNRLLRIATVASFMSFFLLYARGESYLLPRYLLWYSFLPYCLTQILPIKRIDSFEIN